ncbi:MAG TPA: hypothetical protein VK691_02705 [Solirubrobacteraceae bacterium]|nr:hypothetical protein [Solirubrobacteraceae bacterium]
MTDFLDEKRREINDRLAELKPLIDEYTRLQDAAAALAGVGGTGTAPRAAASAPAASSATPARRGPGRPRGSKSRTTGARRGRPPKAAKAAEATTAAATPRRRAGRRKGSGTRAAQALQFVSGQPGITIPELAAKMGIKQNYLYRVLPGLEQEKKIKKQGRGWHPAG